MQLSSGDIQVGGDFTDRDEFKDAGIAFYELMISFFRGVTVFVEDMVIGLIKSACTKWILRVESYTKWLRVAQPAQGTLPNLRAR